MSKYIVVGLLLLYTSSVAQKPKLVLPLGHTDMGMGTLSGATYSPDNKYILTHSTSSLKLWEVKSGRLLYILEGHSTGINSSDYSADGKYILSSGKDTKIWDAGTGNLRYTLRDSNYDYRAYAMFSPDGKFIATSGKGAKIWNKQSGKLKHSLTGAEDLGPQITFSKDGKYLVTGSTTYDSASHHVVKVWEVASGLLVNTFDSFSFDYMTSHCFSPDGNFIAATSLEIRGKGRGAFLVLWNRENKQVKKTLIRPYRFSDEFTFSRSSAVISPNGALIVTTLPRDRISVWDSKTATLKFNLDDSSTLAAFSPDGKFIITGGITGMIKIWDAKDGTLVKNFEGHKTWLSSITFSRDTKFISTTSADNTVKIWNASDVKLMRTISGQINTITSSRFSADEQSIISVSSDNTVKVWNINPGNFKITAAPVPYIGLDRMVRISPDGRYVVSAEKEEVRIQEIATGVFLPSAKCDKDVMSTAISKDNNFILASSRDSTLRIWETQTGKLIHTIPGAFLKTNFSPDGRYFAAEMTFSRNRNSSVVQVWDFQSGQPAFAFTMNHPATPVVMIMNWYFSPDSKYMVLITNDTLLSRQNKIRTDRVRIWDIRDNKEIFNQVGYIGAISPDNRYLLTKNEFTGSTVDVFDVFANKKHLTLSGHKGAIRETKFSPDGKWILTTASDNSAKIWDAQTGKIIHTLEGHSNLIYSAAFSPNGNYIVTNSADGTSILWNAKTGVPYYKYVSVNQSDHLSLDSAGRYDGSEKARKLLYYVCDREVIELEQFKSLSWEPHLVSKIIGTNKEPITARGISDVDICNLTPRIEEKGINDGAYNFEILRRKGGLGDISLFVNNKQIRSFSPEQLIKNGDTYKLKIDQRIVKPYLLSYGENRVEVMALTANSEFKSQRATLVVDNKDKLPLINLYAVSVGISRYKDDLLKLSYASKDAQILANVVTKSAGKLLNIDTTQHVFSYTYTTDKPEKWPSKDNIRKAFEEIAVKATANDIIVVFLAGHGILKPGEKEFYFLTQEATGPNLSGVEKQVAISTVELDAWMRKIKAQKQILILDACNSGEVVTELQKLITRREVPSDQLRALERLKDKAGTFILSASASGQSAYESSLFEQGILTYSLLAGLKYGNGLRDKKYIDVSMWFNHAVDQVRILARDIGSRQDPQIIGSASFEVGIVDEKISEEIVLSIKKKIFTRSRFVSDEKLLSDDIDLSGTVDQELRELSETGVESPLVYVDDNSIKDAYSIRGSYKVAGDDVIANVLLFRNNKMLDQFEISGSVQEKGKLAAEISSKIRAKVVGMN